MSKYTAGRVEALITAAEYIDSEDGDPYLDYAEAAEISGALRGLAATLRQQAERGDGVVSDEIRGLLAHVYGMGAARGHHYTVEGGYTAYTHNEWSDAYREAIDEAISEDAETFTPLLRAPAEQGGHKSELAKNLANALVDPSKVSSDNTYVRVDCSDAVRAAELLRTIPAEQGGRVDFSEADGAALRSLKVGEVLTEGQWESACRFVRHQDDIIRNLRAALAQNAQGEAVGEYVANIDKHGGVIWRDGPPPHGSKLYLHTKQDALVEELESLLKTPVGAPTSANGLKWCDICCKEVPERWKLVPCEPTVEMLDAGFIAYEGAEFRKGRASWQAMLAAAPSQPEDAA